MTSDFERLVRAAEAAPIEGWNFDFLDGRAVEERPTWRYFDRVCERVATAESLLEIQAGTGAMIGTLPAGPALAVATDGHPPSIAIAGPRLRARAMHLVAVSPTDVGLPFASDTFGLVISRHPIEPWWPEIARVLRPGGSYFAQHVGPHSLRTLSERFLGPLPEQSQRHPDVERRAAQDAGLVVDAMDLERPRVAFFDIGAVVYFLRLVPWIVPGFTTTRYYDALFDLHCAIRADGAFETTASRTLVDAHKPGV